MKNKILIITTLYISAYVMQSCGYSNKDKSKTEMDTPIAGEHPKDTMDSGNMNMDNRMMQSMNMMMDKMNDMKMSGDFDLDFANMMIMHHQAAIDMSEVEIAKGTDAQVKTMAQNIIPAQKAEIDQFQRFIRNYKKSEAKMKNEEMHNQVGETMHNMMDKMHNMKMSGNIDKDFVMMMIPHHESAVAMAEDELAHGHHTELKKMAQKIIADQKKEIVILKAWHAEHN